jgi:hypothetical protein
MSAPASPTQWYLARDGQQFGPLSDAELAKFIELGHLQPNDLLWRDGFPDWRPAQVVFPPRAGTPQRSAPAPQPARSSLGASRPERPRYEDDEMPRRRRGGRALAILLIVGVVGAAAWYAYPHRARLTQFMSSIAALAPSSPIEIADRKSLEVPPLAGFSGTQQEIDAKLQTTALWRVIKREFPDWYTQRLTEAIALARENKNEAAIGQHMARKLVELRRQQVSNALSATLPRLKGVAAAFFDNLVKLRQHGVESCYGFISQGEANPGIVAMLQGSDHTVHLQTQLTAVFEAIAEGRKQPRVYPQPRQADYDMLAADLAKRGWTPADMQLFSDERALAKAAPDKVCQMVHDWFAAQLAIKDPDAQMRLLVDSLRPVVAG